jgi:hypothetical protein
MPSGTQSATFSMFFNIRKPRKGVAIQACVADSAVLASPSHPCSDQQNADRPKDSGVDPPKLCAATESLEDKNPSNSRDHQEQNSDRQSRRSFLHVLDLYVFMNLILMRHKSLAE